MSLLPYQEPYTFDQGHVTNMEELLPQSPRPRTEAERNDVSLRQITESLSRIRQVRRSIRELNRDQVARANDMDPGHESIILTNQDPETERNELLSSLSNSNIADNRIIAAMDFHDPRDLVPEPVWEYNESLDHLPITTRRNEASMAPPQRPMDLPPLDTISLRSDRVRNPHTAPLHNPPHHPPPAHSQRRNMSVRSALESRVRPISLPSSISPDDPNTLLGQRVAAREAAGHSLATENPSASNSVAGPSSGPTTADLASRISELRPDLEQFRDLIRQRRAEAAVLLDNSFARRRSAEVQTGPSPAADSPRSSVPNVRSPLSANAPWRSTRFFPNSGRERERTNSSLGSVETRQNSGQSTGRLSLLSNIGPIQNLASPLSATSTRPLLFEEPASFVDEPMMLAQPSIPPVHEPGIRQTDGIFPRRRSNSMTNRRSQPLPSSLDDFQPLSSSTFALDFEDIELERFIAETMAQHPRAGDSQSNESNLRQRQLDAGFRQTMGSPARRPEWLRRIYTLRRDSPNPREEGSREPRPTRTSRVWVRLDPDGNEIDSAVDFEAERQARVESFTTMLGSSRSPPSPRNAMSLSDSSPMTRLQPPLDSDPSAPPRVRLASNSSSSHLRQNYMTALESLYGGHQSSRVLKKSENGKPLAGVLGSMTEYKPSLLPVPAEDMLNSKSQNSEKKGMFVVTTKVFAGR